MGMGTRWEMVVVEDAEAENGQEEEGDESNGQPPTHTEFPEKFVQKEKSGDEHNATLGGERVT